VSRRRYFVRQGDRDIAVDVETTGPGRFRASVAGSPARELTLLHAGASTALLVDGRVVELYAGASGAEVTHPRRRILVSARARVADDARATTAGEALLRAPMPGRVLKLLVSEGQVVTAGMGVLVVEAMKMENELLAPRAGTVKRILVEAGATVERDAPLLELE
jgi:glutaconyl-CoA/methylmalonyl-CoA decarboxylase subunit gamma